MAKYAIEKHFKGKFMNLVCDAIYHDKDKAQEIADTLTANAEKLGANGLKYKVVEYENFEK